MATLKSELVLSLIDRLSGPAKKAGGSLDNIGRSAKTAGKAASKEMEMLTGALKKTQEQSEKLDLFKSLQKKLPAARQAFRTAQADVERLGKEIAKAKKVADSYDGIKAFSKNGGIAKEMADARKKVSDLEHEMSRAQRTVTRTGDSFKRQADAVLAAKRSLTDMGVSLKSVGNAEASLKSKIDQTTNAMKRQIDMENKAAAAAERSAARREKFGRAYQALAATSAGSIATAHFLAKPALKAMNYDQQLTYVAQTIAGGGTIEERRTAKLEASDWIDNAIQQGGGKREDALKALNTLTASGAFEKDELKQVLAETVKTAFATGADAEDAAKSAVAMRNNGVAVNEIQDGFDSMVRAGELGGVEFRDMSKWLPQQLALGRGVGIRGLNGVRDLSALNQVALSTAGTPDEAANNLVNLLQKLNSRELQDTMAKNVAPQKGDPVTVTTKGSGKNKKTEVKYDWQADMLKGMKNGVDPIELFAGRLDKELAKDKSYQSIKNQLSNAKTPEEQSALLERMTGIAEASTFGEMIADRQALMAALSVYYGRDKKANLDKDIENASGTTDANSKFVREQTWSKTQDVQNSLDRANEESYRALEEPLGALTERLNEAARAFPNFTAGLYAGSNILAALGAGGLVGGAASILTGGVALHGSASALNRSAAALTTAAAKLGGSTSGPWSGPSSDSGKKAGSKNLPLSQLAGFAVPYAALAYEAGSGAEDFLQRDRAGSDTVRRLAGDEVVQQAREKYQPMLSRIQSFGQYDKDDPKYVRKHLLDGIKESTEGWPAAAKDGLRRYTEEIAQGGESAITHAAAIADEIKTTLSVTGSPNVDMSKIDAAIARAQLLGRVLNAAPSATSAPAAVPAIEARASGGPVRAGVPYLVGEKGPELFMPGASGAIAAARETALMGDRILAMMPAPPEPRPLPASAMSGGAGRAAGPVAHSFNITMNVTGTTDPEKVAKDVTRRLSSDISREMRAYFSDGII